MSGIIWLSAVAWGLTAEAVHGADGTGPKISKG